MLSLLVCFNVPQYTTAMSGRCSEVDALPRENQLTSIVVEEGDDLIIVVPADVAELSAQQRRALTALTVRHGSADVVLSSTTQQRPNAVDSNWRSLLHDITEWPYNGSRFARRFYPSYVRLGF